jgi:UDP:flavonoid glycosyltransferase YjiC (YdhE family)
MRVDILAIGSLGDVQPYIALGLGLEKLGHRVRIVTLGGFEEFVARHGLDHLSIGGSGRDILDAAHGRDGQTRRVSGITFLRSLLRIVDPLIEANIATYWPLCRDVEALIMSSPLGLFVGGAYIAERLGIPLIRAEVHPRHDWEARRILAAAVRGDLTALFVNLLRLLMWSKLRRNTNAARQKILGLPPLRLSEPFGAMDRKHVPLLLAYSPAVVPRPAHWGDWIHVTGYWFLDDPGGWVPPADLVDFLDAGPPPVFVGFGSNPFPDPETATKLVVRSLARAGRRGVVLAGGSGLASGRLGEGVLSVDFAPHNWLFSRVCAAVHHGGAGVTGAALRAGLPSVVVPVLVDQPFWARRVFELGAGPRPIPAKQLTEDALASAIRATAGTEMRRRAAALGEQIRKEDGVARAVEAFHRYVRAVH